MVKTMRLMMTFTMLFPSKNSTFHQDPLKHPVSPPPQHLALPGTHLIRCKSCSLLIAKLCVYLRLGYVYQTFKKLLHTSILTKSCSSPIVKLKVTKQEVREGKGKKRRFFFYWWQSLACVKLKMLNKFNDKKHQSSRQMLTLSD